MTVKVPAHIMELGKIIDPGLKDLDGSVLIVRVDVHKIKGPRLREEGEYKYVAVIYNITTHRRTHTHEPIET